jgi:undecaprenyl-diphosphatase
MKSNLLSRVAPIPIALALATLLAASTAFSRATIGEADTSSAAPSRTPGAVAGADRAAVSHATIGEAGADSAAVPGAVFVPPAAPDSTSLNVKIFRLLNGAARNRVFDAVMPLASDFAKWRYVVILIWCALVMFGKTKGRWAALMLIPIIAASDQLASSVMKPVFSTLRPCELIGNVHLWLDNQGWITTPAEVTRSYKNSLAFPSSHAANITASMLFLGLAYRRWLAPLLAVALLVSYSRIYTGVHWPSDVLGGMLVGAVIAVLAYALFKRFPEWGRRTGTDGRDAEGAADEAPKDSSSHDSTI